MISLAVDARALYSVSVEDLDTVSYLLADHEIKFEPRKMQNPVVDLRVSLQPAQSLSLKAVRGRSLSFLIVNPAIL